MPAEDAAPPAATFDSAPPLAGAPRLRLGDREAVLRHAAELILASWRSFDRARADQPPVGPQVRELLAQPLPELPGDPAEALDDAARVLDQSLAPSRPRYFAYVGSSGLEIGVLGDALMASHDVNVAVRAGGADLLERQVVRWVGEFCGFGACEGLFASGGTISNLTALCAAREQAAPGFRHEGAGSRRLALYCSAEAHYSIVRAAEVLGIGARHVRAIPTDDQRRMRADACAAAIEADRAAGIVPMAVVATAGTTLTGAVDPIAPLADVCAAQGVWLHVDGAYGLPAAATEAAQAQFAGLDRADSATVDAHKWLYVPKACSVLLVRDGKALERAFSHRGDYIPHDEDARAHAVDRTLEYSRPLRALKLWLAFTVHGAAALRAAIAHNLDEARQLAERVKAHPDLELLTGPQLSVVCFRHVPSDSEGLSAIGLDIHNARLAEALQRDGRIYLASAQLDRVTCLRACIVNYRTEAEDVRAIVDVTAEVAAGLG
jgi:aromatic-L-amino-acid decarboxylase